MSRPRQLGGGLAKILPLAIVGLLVAFAVAPGFRHSAHHGVNRVGNDIRSLVDPQYSLEKPSNVAATSALTQEPAYNAFDEISGSPWETAAPDDGVGQSITASFKTPVTIDQMIFTIGTGLQASYESEPRPEQVRVTLQNARGTVVGQKVFTLNDKPAPQNVTIHGKHVTEATVTILTVYPSPQGSNTAIDEIEFFNKT